jgi:hypothetical protein
LVRAYIWSVLAVDENAVFAEENRVCLANLKCAKPIVKSDRLPRHGSRA